MNDELEVRLRSAFRRDSLPAAPVTLLDALDRVVEEPVRREPVSRRVTGRRPWRALAVAAILLIGGGVALSVGNRSPDPAPSPTPPASPGPSADTGTRLIYEPQWTAERPFDVDDLAAIAGIAQQRVDATGAVGVVVSTDDAAHLVVDVPPGVDPEPIRSLVGVTGFVSFVPVGATPLDVGATVDLASYPPLFDGTAVKGATVVTSQTGDAALELALDDEAAALLAAYTASHIGETLAITLDGVVVAAPVIQSEIPNGKIRIEFAVDRPMSVSELAGLATVMRNGPLPVPLVEISSGPAPSPVATTEVAPSSEVRSRSITDRGLSRRSRDLRILQVPAPGGVAG